MTNANPEPSNLRLRGAGGSIFRYQIAKLNEHTLKQIEAGRLQPVDAASAKALADAGIKAGI